MSLPGTVADDWANTVAPANPANPNGGQKKPRHRHAPEQLAALNELFEKDEHPPLEIRAALAERLAMETKTVNAWFQNKRASSKKRTRAVANDKASGSHSNSNPGPSSSAAPGPSPPATSTPADEDFQATTTRIQQPVPSKMPVSEIIQGPTVSTFVADYQLSSGRSSPDNSKKMRNRPSPDQTEELKKLYVTSPHPSTEERQNLANRIGMRYQSVTNWFQNQRSIAKRRKDDEPMEGSQSSSKSDYLHLGGDSRQYSAFPPPPPHQMHPSLTALSNTALSLQDPHVTKKASQRSPSLPPPASHEVSPRRSMRRSVTPYSSAMSSRPRRSRPEPYQLDALKDLFTRTSTPTIEERSALALEIGMDVGKVTNWFRNLRQTARKRSTRFNDNDQDDPHSGFDDDFVDQDDLSPYSSGGSASRPPSRNGTPSLSARSSSSSSLDRDVHMRGPPYSSVPSDDEDYSEAITPEPGNSPSPAPGPRRFEGRELPPPRPIREASYPTSLPPLPAPPPPPPSSASNSYPYHYSSSQQPYPPAPPYYSHPPGLPGKLGGPKTATPDLSFPNFSASVAIFGSSPSSYDNPASKPYYANEDPTTCAATAKRFGIPIEDAYLLLDFSFHRQ